MKNRRILAVKQIWPALFLLLALLPQGGIVGAEASLDQQSIDDERPRTVGLLRINGAEPRSQQHLFSYVPLVGGCELADTKRPTIDLLDLMTLFMIPEAASYNVLPWETGAHSGSPIEWKTEGVERRGPAKADIRHGEAIVTIDGKPLCRLRKYIEPAPWTVTLIGSNAGVDEIIMTPQTECAVDLEAQLRKRNISFGLYKCDPQPLAGSERKIFSVKAASMNRAWLYIDVSCGSAGCSCSFRLFLNERDADQVPDLGTDCTKNAGE